MTDTTDPQTAEPLRIPIAHSVCYAARGLPEVPNQYGRGVLAPSEITLTYRAAPDSGLGRVHAYVAGRLWVDGVEIPLLPSGLYGQHYDDGLDGWPEWLAEEARLHDPDADRAAVLDEAADDEGDELVCVDECGLCDACGMEPFGTPAEGWREAARFLRRTARESGDRQGALHGARLIEAELRRLADEAQPTTEAQPQPCAHCGKDILRRSGTLTVWWVHDPGGNTSCFPQHAASSTRATPKPVTEERHTDTGPVKESTRRYAAELRGTPGTVVADGHTGWECDAGASLIVEASTPGPGKLGTHHGVIYACAGHRAAAEERITGAGYEVDPRSAPPGHRWNPWPCGHVTAHDSAALAALAVVDGPTAGARQDGAQQ